MSIANFSLERVTYPLRVNWVISRGGSPEKNNFYIKEGDIIHSEFAPNIRFGDSDKLIERQFESFIEKYQREEEIEKLLYALDQLVLDGKMSTSLGAGIEMAILNRLGKFDFSKKEHGECSTSISVPIMEFRDFKNFFSQFDLHRFSLVKVKSGANFPSEIINFICDHSEAKFCIDFNEALLSINDFEIVNSQLSNNNRLVFLEQPFASDMFEEYREIKNRLDVPVIIDETITTQLIDEAYLDICDGVNIKVMKSGGIRRAIRQIDSAKKLGLLTMVGCMIESSLSVERYISMTKNVDFYDLDGYLFLKYDPFSKLKLKNGVFI